MRWASPIFLAISAIAVTARPQQDHARHASGSSPSGPLGVVSADAEPPHSFWCGQSACDPRESYCETRHTDAPELPSNYACRALPLGCLPRSTGQQPDCGCFPAGTRGDFCSSATRGGVREFYRTCIGGH